ncbi:16S rRNA (cytidine(1402)-2'-O)-methyltransferase [Geotoga petraea]|uniref:Ribosomal RNA small subunit methyltransferase I n=1 Tax=Geotoga petraea TaxID=28234 RepID=A0A1G6N4C2_9BACT|nr:16S rRNA (cytidine(1402)-2'-O)-methyltransferase [Geotoga petraea]MDK2945534.1 rRNA (cytidine1402-2-O)-methyltransferase [Geotoga sp.]SDC62680.1 16S rRNA (cytidine1402-2'-O)-methyltransferase [Geotoga petraea]
MGKLYIVGTPIGNLEDISIRALKTLKKADLILTEDKRVTIKLLNALEIGEKNLFTFNQVNSERKIHQVLELLKTYERVCLVSDAGMPVISDPGSNLIDSCYKENIEIDIIPGPSAPIATLAASGFPGSKFTFLGFLPRDKNRRRLFRKIKDNLESEIYIFFDSPNRLLSTLKDLENIIGDVEVFIAREITKLHQEFFKGTTDEVIEHFNNNPLKGEITVAFSKRKPFS